VDRSPETIMSSQGRSWKQKIRDEVARLTVDELVVESTRWWVLTNADPPPGWTPRVLADQAEQLQEIVRMVETLEGRGEPPESPEYARPRERLALYCERQRRRHGGNPPPPPAVSEEEAAVRFKPRSKKGGNGHR
jgi:hypothetical protein